MMGRGSEALWRGGALALSLFLILPLAAVAWIALSAQADVWPHLIATVLPGYVQRTVLLMAGVGVLTLVIGTGTAWLVSMCEFPLRRWFSWALVLPLAMPGYIIAYTYVHSFEFAGPVQTALRAAFGWRHGDYWFPEIRSMAGAVTVMSLVLYPYVFLTARAAFLKLSPHHMEAARTLGRSPWGAFFRVALPLARPALAVGVTLAVMEAINDIGAVNFFGVRTLSLGIYTTWLAQGNLGGAAQIAGVMLIFVFGLIWIEQRGRRAQGFHSRGHQDAPSRRVELGGFNGWAAFAACLIPCVLGFVLPAVILFSFAVEHGGMLEDAAFHRASRNTLLLAAAAAAVTVMAGLFLAYAKRMARGRVVAFTVKLASIGYAVPGTVLGIGILVPLSGFDNGLDAFMRAQFGISTGLILSGTVFAVMLGYAIRFLAISFGNLETGLERVTPSLSAAARTLGRGPFATLMSIHIPLLRPAMGAALLLVFVDCMKELPATLILRPFDFDTLATLVYALASLDQLEESALPALAIVAAGILPVILISRGMARDAEKKAPIFPDLTAG
ncbi:MAG: iron ABC transporter permease [Aestuariivirgaceae bacterium]|nr:iron ABC transporter permease [Aestuariivirgaceae bacterium]